jgi:hypothetical protein
MGGDALGYWPTMPEQGGVSRVRDAIVLQLSSQDLQRPINNLLRNTDNSNSR